MLLVSFDTDYVILFCKVVIQFFSYLKYFDIHDF
jgi:hypothetical protein